MSVKLEVGKWYQHEYSYHGTFLQLVDPCVRDDETIGMYNPAEPNNDWRSIPSYLRGPHSIEPGDVVKPKPAEDKCWKGHDWGIGQGEFTVDGVDRVNWNYEEWGYFEGNNILGDGKNWPISTLILVRKAEKAQPQPDNKSEFKLIRRAGEIKAENTTRVWIRPGHGHAFPTPNGTKTYENHSDKAVEVEFCHYTGLFKQVNKAAGVGPTEPTSGVLNKGTISASPAAPKLNPATLPSLSGSELVWPDVKCEKPKESECRLCSGGYNYWMNYMGDDSELFAQFQGLAMGFDCEPLNRCIPCIECHTEDYRQTIDNFTKFKRSLEPKKLTQLKGRL